MARANDETRTDARWLRTHAALREAALALAADHPIDELSLAIVARTADVSRSTAYEHATTPRDLIEEALLEDLDAIRREHLIGISPAQTPRATVASTLATIAHIERHAELYTRALAPEAGAGSLHGMLAGHIAASVAVLLDADDVQHGIPARTARARRAIDAIVVRGIADGTVGQISAWLALPAPRDPRLFVTVNQHLLPEWWPKS